MPIYPDGEGRFRVTVWKDGRQRERRVRGTRARAEAVLVDLLAQAAELVDPPHRRRAWPTCAGVYFVSMGRRGPIKIGIAENIRRRLNAIQVHSPYPLHLLWHIPGAGVHEERALHRLFRAQHLRGEWYRPSGALLEGIAEFRAQRAREALQ